MGIVLQVEIRSERAGDYERVFEVEQSAFGSPIQPRLVEILRASAKPNLSLVALRGDEVIGHIFFSPVTFESKRAPSAAQLSPVAVAPAFSRRGVGSALIRAGLALCQSQGWEAVFLVGNPLYYSRFGFQMAKSFGLSCSGPLDPFLQVKELQPGAMANVSGHVAFHPAFDESEARSDRDSSGRDAEAR